MQFKSNATFLIVIENTILIFLFQFFSMFTTMLIKKLYSVIDFIILHKLHSSASYFKFSENTGGIDEECREGINFFRF